jgi:hypothetical protein
MLSTAAVDAVVEEPVVVDAEIINAAEDNPWPFAIKRECPQHLN